MPRAVRRPLHPLGGLLVFDDELAERLAATGGRGRLREPVSRGNSGTTPNIKPTQCPKCESKRVAPILYGFPAEDLSDAVKKGEVVLGGCCVSDNDPEWACVDCDHRWGVGG